VSLQNLLKSFVLPTLQFFTLVESKFILNLNIRKNSWFSNTEVLLKDSIFFMFAASVKTHHT